MAAVEKRALCAAITCDQCRNRKVRCNPGPMLDAASPHSQCRNCSRRSEKCTFDYTPKKPGRPRAPTKKRSRSHSPSSTPPSGQQQRRDAPMTTSPTTSLSLGPTPQSHVDPTELLLPSLQPNPPGSPGPIFGSIFGSARQTLQSIEFDYTLPPSRTRPPSPGPGLDQLPSSPQLPPPQAVPLTHAGNASLGLDAVTWPAALKPSTSTIQPPPAPPYSPSTTLADLVAASDAVPSATPAVPGIDISRIESFATWDEIGFFLSLHMKHQHMLVPLVHRPSFAQDVLHRRDEGDEAFRGLLLSMVSYTIAQCPINWLMGRMEKPALEKLLERCQRGSRIIQIRHQTRPSLVVLGSTILDWITSQSAAPAEVPAVLMADVRRLIYTLGLNREVPRDGMTPLELDLGRRLFWEGYAIDKTNALNGNPMQLLDMDGVPPLPLEVDDEFLSPHLPADVAYQPPGRLSYMAGFIAVSKLFKILSGCIVRHRTLVNDPDSAQDSETLRAYVARSLEYVQALLASMPDQLQPGNASDANTVFGTQAANVYITALCIELALLDLRAKVSDEDDETARYEIAQRAFRQLEHMPLECLASNGESMRGKVLRVILALLNATHEGTLGEGLWDWWNMYSRVQFIQLMPEVPAAA